MANVSVPLGSASAVMIVSTRKPMQPIAAPAVINVNQDKAVAMALVLTSKVAKSIAEVVAKNVLQTKAVATVPASTSKKTSTTAVAVERSVPVDNNVTKVLAGLPVLALAPLTQIAPNAQERPFALEENATLQERDSAVLAPVPPVMFASRFKRKTNPIASKTVPQITAFARIIPMDELLASRWPRTLRGKISPSVSESLPKAALAVTAHVTKPPARETKVPRSIVQTNMSAKRSLFKRKREMLAISQVI